MRFGVLFSGGKDSTYAAWLAKKDGNELVCLITLESLNKDSFMFHTPSISKVKKQAEVMNIPLIVERTKGVKEEELEDLKKVIKLAIKKYKIEGIITGAVASVYQASRIQKICDEFGIICSNPLWGKNQIKLLEELIERGLEVIIIGVAAYPLDESWLGRKIDSSFVEEMKKLQGKYKINPNGEGGETESFVLNCPLFSKRLKVKSFKDSGSGNSWRREIELA